MRHLLQDLRFALRTCLRNRTFALVAVLTLALGIGANSAIFSVVNAVLLRPLAYAEPDRLLTVYHLYPSLGDLEAGMAAPTYRDLREEVPIFESVAAQSGWGVNLSGEQQPERLLGSRVTQEFFATYGVPAALGRTIQPADAPTGEEPLVVLSHSLWQRLYGGDPRAIGRTMRLDGEPYEIVGVMPAGFSDFFDPNAELWAPLRIPPAAFSARTNEFLMLTARLRPGVSHAEAQREMSAFAERLKAEHAGEYPVDWTLRARALSEQAIGNVRTSLFVLLGAVGFVLLIACANMANLLLARAAARRKEIAIRGALGASRAALVRQLLAESLLLSLAGAAVGLLLAGLALEGLRIWSPANLPRVDEVSIDATVLAFTFGIAVLTGIVFGLVPALQMGRTDLQSTLRQGGRTGSETGGLAARRVLVVAQVALALTLLIGAGLLMRSFARIQAVDPGFEPDRLLTMALALPASRYPSAAERRAFFDRALDEIGTLPGVVAAGAVSTLPFSGMSTNSFGVEGMELADGQPDPWGDFRIVDPGFREAMGVPLLRGRFFDDRDVVGAPGVAVVDQLAAERYWPGGDAVGRRIAFALGPDGEPQWLEIVGVVGHVMQDGATAERRVQVYRPVGQIAPFSLSLVVRSSGDPMTLVGPIRASLRSLDPDQPISQIAAMKDLMRDTLGARRFSMFLFGVFAWIALVLACVGIYGVISFDVARRTKEMGVRLALGAEQTSILRMVMGRGMQLTLIGVALGMVGAFLLTRLLRGQLYEVGTADPATYLGVAALLVAVALLASWIPARRAMRVDPMVALRAE
jgi:putative ABC transport system permease protein